MYFVLEQKKASLLKQSCNSLKHSILLSIDHTCTANIKFSTTAIITFHNNTSHSTYGLISKLLASNFKPVS